MRIRNRAGLVRIYAYGLGNEVEVGSMTSANKGQVIFAFIKKQNVGQDSKYFRKLLTWREQMQNEISITHKVEIAPSEETKVLFRKTFGCVRLTYNWGLARWKEAYQNGEKKSAYDLSKEFTVIKKEQFPFMKEVTSHAIYRVFINLDSAFQKFFRDLKKGQVSYPQFKQKRENFGSFYISNQGVKVKDGKYLFIPKLKTPIKMKEKLRFDGKINSVTISQSGDKYFAAFSMQISKEEYDRTHKACKDNNLAVGIDLGLQNFATLSNGIQIEPLKLIAKYQKQITKRSRQLERKQHSKSKDDGVQKSNNYIKASRKLNKVHRKIANIRNDFLHKLTSSLVRNYKHIGIRDFSVKDMVANLDNMPKQAARNIAKSIMDASFYEFRRQLEYKSKYNDRDFQLLNKAEPFSTKCSNCGEVKEDYDFQNKIYSCKCGLQIDRDLNASLNLLSSMQAIGTVQPEFTPADLVSLLDDLTINQITSNKVETGIA